MKMPVISALLNWTVPFYLVGVFCRTVSWRILADDIYSADCDAKERSIGEFGIICSDLMERDIRIKQLPLVLSGIFDSHHQPLVCSVFVPLKTGQNCQPYATKLHGRGMFPCFVTGNMLWLTDPTYGHNNHQKRKKKKDTIFFQWKDINNFISAGRLKSERF